MGVARQYSGPLGRTETCQVAVSLHLAGEAGSGCLALQLYLPESWATDRARRRPAGVPDDVGFQPKWQIALGQLDDARRWGMRRHVVQADAAYGDVPEFRAGVAQRGLRDVVGVQGPHLVWPPGSHPHPPARPARPAAHALARRAPPARGDGGAGAAAGARGVPAGDLAGGLARPPDLALRRPPRAAGGRA